MNLSGIVVLLLGLFVFIVAIRGTQATVFPFFFGNSGSSGSSGGSNGGSKPQCIVMPDSSGNCPNGYNKQSGLCFFNGDSSTCTGVEY